LHQNLVMGRTPSMLHKLRSNELTIFSAVSIFFIAWFIAQLRIVGQPLVILGMFSYTSESHIVEQPLAIFGMLSYTSGPLLLNTVHTFSYILVALILLGGLPILLAALWQALRTRNHRAFWLGLLGLISPLLAVILTIIYILVTEEIFHFFGPMSTNAVFIVFF